MSNLRSRLPQLAIIVAVGGLVVLAVSGPGYRQAWWSLGTAFTLFTWGAYAGLAAIALGALGLGLNLAGRARRSPSSGPRRSRRLLVSGLAVLIGVLAAGLPWQWQRTARRVPPIHDITTDTITPPAFEAVLPLRADAPNPIVDSPENIAAQQRGYPTLGPLLLPVPPDAAYERALRLVRARGWEIAGADAERHRIEATDTTFWFGFKDDVVIRITPAPEGSRVDMRSVSRVGRSDVGTNARRISAFLGDLAR